jgi:hypothetical protein
MFCRILYELSPKIKEIFLVASFQIIKIKKGMRVQHHENGSINCSIIVGVPWHSRQLLRW